MLNQKIHRKIMFEVLRDIYNSDLGFDLGFKGGTMLYFFYNLNRFSVDLDFDLLNLENENQILKRIEKILMLHGRIDDVYNKNYTLFALLNYKNGERNLKIEIFKRETYKNKYELKNFYGIDVKCMTIEDSFSHKLLATTTRRTAVSRDFFDLYFFWKNGYEFNKDIVEKISGKSKEAYLKYLREYVEKNLNQRNVLQGLGELVLENQKNWIKQNLKKELLSYIDFNLSSVD
ncbi:nucleotidyl transferase AbiEii/AbiGii toxin family protein [Candidatus Parcubacteria bacterium]|nr:nucleotidyl transferase AbiEii/AbiGii toxin family protein [Candidatus Parcubacteria bacterium]